MGSSVLLFLQCIYGLVSSATSSYSGPNIETLYCFDNAEWTGPRPFLAQSSAGVYQNILRRFDAVYVSRDPYTYQEFVAEYATPAFDLPVVYTPFKISRVKFVLEQVSNSNTSQGGVTLAVTTAHDFAPRGRRDLPGLGSGPFPASVRKPWDMIFSGATILRQTCMDDARAPKAGAFWWVGEEPFIHIDGLLIMVYGTGSAIDHQVGPGVPNILRYNKGTNATATERGSLAS